MILYCFICCFKNLHKINYIHDMMKNLGYPHYYIILGHNKTLINPKKKIIFLNCDDSYEGLPNKMVELFKFLSTSKFFKDYTHFFKADDDIMINKIIDYSKLEGDYLGTIQDYEGKRNWHIGKCSPNSVWNKKIYKGEYVPWCKGGYGYILSRKAINVVGNYNENYDDEIYEDLLIGKILLKSDIQPVILNGFHF